jgi:hypothetical protein
LQILKSARNSIVPEPEQQQGVVVDVTEPVKVKGDGVGFGNERNTIDIMPMAARKRVSFGQRQVR